MGKVGTYWHDSLVVDDLAAVDTSFDVAKFHLHDLIPDTNLEGSYPGPPGTRFSTRKTKFANKLEAIHVRVTDIAGGATSLIVRLCADENGDYTLVPDTEATLSTGLTTATSGCIAVEVGIPLFGLVNSDSKFWLFFKTDAGSVTVAQSCITWSE